MFYTVILLQVITAALEVSFGLIEYPGCESLTELMSTIVQRVGDEIDRTHLPRLMVCWNFTYDSLFFIPTHTGSRTKELILLILLS